jgi:hypothetical protein
MTVKIVLRAAGAPAGLWARFLALAIGVVAVGACATPTPLEGAVRYRASSGQVLVLVTGQTHARSTFHRVPALGRTGSPEAEGATVIDVPARVSADALGRLVAELDDLGYFDLPGTASPESPFPTFAIDVRASGAEVDRRHFVALAKLRTGPEADVFARAAGEILRAAGRR